MLRNALRPAARSLRVPSRAAASRPLPAFHAVARARDLHTTTPRHGTATLPNILAGGPAPPVVVKQLTPRGLQLASGLLVPGPCIFLEGEVYLWDVPPVDAWEALGAREVRAMFEVFETVVPRPEILLLGMGKSVALPPPALRKYLNEIGIQVDILDTGNACSTYNLLAEEGRRVAAALLPLTPYSWKQ